MGIPSFLFPFAVSHDLSKEGIVIGPVVTAHPKHLIHTQPILKEVSYKCEVGHITMPHAKGCYALAQVLPCFLLACSLVVQLQINCVAIVDLLQDKPYSIPRFVPNHIIVLSQS